MAQQVNMSDNTSAVMTRVQAYIDMNVYNSAVWDVLEDTMLTEY